MTARQAAQPALTPTLSGRHPAPDDAVHAVGGHHEVGLQRCVRPSVTAGRSPGVARTPRTATPVRISHPVAEPGDQRVVQILAVHHDRRVAAGARAGPATAVRPAYPAGRARGWRSRPARRRGPARAARARRWATATARSGRPVPGRRAPAGSPASRYGPARRPRRGRLRRRPPPRPYASACSPRPGSALVGGAHGPAGGRLGPILGHRGRGAVGPGVCRGGVVGLLRDLVGVVRPRRPPSSSSVVGAVGPRRRLSSSVSSSAKSSSAGMLASTRSAPSSPSGRRPVPARVHRRPRRPPPIGPVAVAAAAVAPTPRAADPCAVGFVPSRSPRDRSRAERRRCARTSGTRSSADRPGSRQPVRRPAPPRPGTRNSCGPRTRTK